MLILTLPVGNTIYGILHHKFKSLNHENDNCSTTLFGSI